jgi:hypothetical protein
MVSSGIWHGSSVGCGGFCSCRARLWCSILELLLVVAVPKIFALVEDLDPDGVCVDILHACPPVPPPGQIVSARLQPRKLPPHLAKLSAKVQTVLEANLRSNCDTCKAVITEAATLLSNPVSPGMDRNTVV